MIDWEQSLPVRVSSDGQPVEMTDQERRFIIRFRQTIFPLLEQCFGPMGKVTLDTFLSLDMEGAKTVLRGYLQAKSYRELGLDE